MHHNTFNQSIKNIWHLLTKTNFVLITDKQSNIYNANNTVKVKPNGGILVPKRNGKFEPSAR